MEHVMSTDGTPIAYRRTGVGPPLVLVHGGAASDHTRWNPLVACIQDRFTVYAMDRRGRGESGDAIEYALHREIDDVVALAATIEGSVCLYGVSLGAVLALEAAPRIPHLHRLALYEPLVSDGTDLNPPGFIDRIEKLVDAGDAEEAIIAYLHEGGGVPRNDIEALRETPGWPLRVRAAHTLAREERAISDYRLEPGRFRDLTVPVLLLLGSESPQMFRTTTDHLHAVLPDSQVHTLDGQGHLADVMAPRQVADTLSAFLLEE
jgi:pimeloyl-ACP methyl ester carboxylesterase